MKNYAHKLNHKVIAQKKKTNHKERTSRAPKISEPFQVLKKLLNIDVYNYESKIEESETNIYSMMTTCETLSDNNSNSIMHDRRVKHQTLESVPRSANQKNSSNTNLKEIQNDKTVLEEKIVNKEPSDFVVTVMVNSEVSEKVKDEIQASQLPKRSTRKEKGNPKQHRNKEKPYFICYRCENLVPRVIGIKCQKLQCHESRKCKQLFHSEEYIMIHKAKCHPPDQDRKSETSDEKELLDSNETEGSNYDQIYAEKRVLTPKEDKKNREKASEKTKRANKHKNEGNSFVSKFRDDIAAKIAKLKFKRRGNDSSVCHCQKDNSNKHKARHIPFEWLNDEACDTSDTSMPSPCTLNSETRSYKARDFTKRPETTTKNEVRVDEMKGNKKIRENRTILAKRTDKSFSNTGDGVTMTKEKLVSMNFMFDHPEIDKKRLAITNDIKLRVVDSSTFATGEQTAGGKRNSPVKLKEKHSSNNRNTHTERGSSTFHKEREKEKQISQLKPEKIRRMRNVNNSEISVVKKDRPNLHCLKTENMNDNNRISMPYPTAPGKPFRTKYVSHEMNERLPPIGNVRSNFRPPPFACSHVQSQIPSQYRSMPRTDQALMNDQCCPTLYNYNHRQHLCANSVEQRNIPKLPWSIVARRMETFNRISDPPALKYSYSSNSPQQNFDQIQDSPSSKNIPMFSTNRNPKFSEVEQHQLDDLKRQLYFRNIEDKQTLNNSSQVVPKFEMIKNNRHPGRFSGYEQSNVTRRLSNFHRARQLAHNINQQFPGLMI